MKVSIEPYELDDWELIQRRLARREFSEAELYLRHMIARRGLRPTYAALLARVLKRIGKYNEALSILSESLQWHPDSMRLHAETGDTHFARMNYVQSAESYSNALSANEEDCFNPIVKKLMQDNFAHSKCLLGDAVEAAALLRPLVIEYPAEKRFLEHYTLALAKSVEDINTVNLPNIEEPFARYQSIFLCKNLLTENRFHNTLRCSEQALEKYRDIPQVIYGHADVLFRLLRLDEAINVLEKAICRCVDIALYVALAKCYGAAGKIQSERDINLAGIFHFPNNVAFLYSLLKIDFSLGKLSECRKYCEKIIAIPGACLYLADMEAAHAFWSVFKYRETGERTRIEECLDDFKNSSARISWADAHDPAKVVLPKEAPNDLPERSDVNVVFRNNAMAYLDTQSLRYNVKNGCRVVVNQPSEYAYTVFIIGWCLTDTAWCDSVTLASALQDVFNSRSDEKVRVVNYGGSGFIGSSENAWLRLMHSGEIRPGDKIFHYDRSPIYVCRNNRYDDLFDRRIAEYNMFRNDLSQKGAGFYIGFIPMLANDLF